MRVDTLEEIENEEREEAKHLKKLKKNYGIFYPFRTLIKIVLTCASLSIAAMICSFVWVIASKSIHPFTQTACICALLSGFVVGVYLIGKGLSWSLSSIWEKM